MIIIEKNEGTKIPYEQDGTRLIFDDSLMVNCQKYQKDWPVHIDIVADVFGDLAMVSKVAGDCRYVAQIDIPATEYEESESTDASEGGASQTAIPLDMDKVTLTLWAVNN